MSFGLNCYRFDGVLLFSADEDSAAFLDMFSVPSGSGTVTQQYPTFAGRQIEAITTVESPIATADTAVSYPSGVPTVTITRGGSMQRVSVMLL